MVPLGNGSLTSTIIPGLEAAGVTEIKLQESGTLVHEDHVTVVAMALRTAGDIGRFGRGGCCDLNGPLLTK